MKKTEIAAQVFAAVSSLELTDIEDGPLVVLLADLCGLMLVPWFCDGSIQWALRLTSPGPNALPTPGITEKAQTHRSLNCAEDGARRDTMLFDRQVVIIR